MDDLLFAWAVEAGVTSNSVLFVRDGATVAVGTGEQDRVGCVQLTIHKAYTKYADWLCFTEQGVSLYELQPRRRPMWMPARLARHPIPDQLAKGGLPGSVLVSDGFFPFRDGVDLAVAQGVTAIAQPGGSIRDHEVIRRSTRLIPRWPWFSPDSAPFGIDRIWMTISQSIQPPGPGCIGRIPPGQSGPRSWPLLNPGGSVLANKRAGAPCSPSAAGK
jgi:hypothetical protein